MIKADEFWQFSLSYYQQNKNEESLLFWQNEHDANVNLALLCIYLDELNVSLPEDKLHHLHVLAKAYESKITQPIRNLRNDFKKLQSTMPSYTEIRQHLLQAELTVEQDQQRELVTSCNSFGVVQFNFNDPTNKANNWAQYQNLLTK